jgi:hypothetical protein
MIAMRLRMATPFSGVSGTPATVAEPEDGASSVPSVRTVVVLPAPFGPRKPKTSPCSIWNDTFSNATRSPNRFVRWSTVMAGGRAWTLTAPERTPVADPRPAR